MADNPFKGEKGKKAIAVALCCALAVVIVYELFLSGGPESGGGKKPAQNPPAQSPAATMTAPAQTAKNPAPQAPNAGDPKARLQELLSDTSPLDLSVLGKDREGKETARGNIFAYYVKPPITVPPPPPPPITLKFMQPMSAVAGTPKAITLVVAAEKAPPDAVLSFGGATKPLKKINETQYSTEIEPGDYSTSRNIEVKIFSKADPKFDSNPLQFGVQAPPPFPYKMVGRIGDLAVLELNGGSQQMGPGVYMRARKGETVAQYWRVDLISETGMELTDTRYNIKEPIRLEEKRQ